MMGQKFLVTEESGRLARWLRLMGYDTTVQAADPLSSLYRLAYNERRIVVTRNRRVGASCLFRVVQFTSSVLAEQLRQLKQELSLSEAEAFSRCDACNAVLQPVDKSQVKARVPPYVFETQTRFTRCPSCQRIYWAATHYARASKFLKSLA
jgi:uncharacterized protein with PIN domain